jgi:hypothetical protein
MSTARRTRTERAQPALRGALACALLLAGTAGCGLFEPRDPEQPSEGRLGFEPPLSREIVITNLQTAVSQKDLANYMRCLNNPAASPLGFQFLPSVNVRNEFPAWGWTDEEAYFRNLVGSAQGGEVPALSLPNARWQQSGSDSAEFIADYVLVFRHTRPGLPQVARGSIQLYLFNDQSFWRIIRWVDNRTDTDSTWSLLKRNF